MRYLIGADIGTSGTKTVLFDENLNTVASFTAEYPLFQPQLMWAEQSPEDWYVAVCAGIRGVLQKSGVPGEAVAGLGLSGQMHGLVLLDESGAVLRPAILWCDQRTEKQCREMTEEIGREELIRRTANPALTGFTAAKLLWVQEEEPELWAKARHILLPKDYVRFRLTGDFATEVSDAGGMQLFDVENRRWSAEMLSFFGINEEMLGKVYESPEITGYLHADAARKTGLTEKTAVVGGAGDQAAAAIGNGIVEVNTLSDTLGSSGVVFACTDKPLIDPAGRIHTFCHAVPGMWHCMGVTQGCGLSLKWFRDNFCHAELSEAKKSGLDAYDLMTEEASTVPPGSEGLVFLPYLMGERSPILAPKARGAFYGLTNAHTRAHLIRAVLEGIAFSQKDCYEVMRSLGLSAAVLRMGGGGAKSVFWRQIFADCFGLPVVTAANTEGGALGAAILAGVGTGLFPDVPSACNRACAQAERLLPGSTDYRAAFRRYKKLYSLQKPMEEETE